jgi:PAS domain S-box-containing protein
MTTGAVPNPPEAGQLRSVLNSMADQLCLAVDGQFDFTVKTDAQDDTIEKLQLLINFVLDAARRSVSELEEQRLALEREIAERRQADQARQDSEQRLQAILDTVPGGILLIDAETHLISAANPAALKMIGAPSEQVLGRRCHNFVCPAHDGRCPITDLGQEADNAERVLLTASGQRTPILKSVTRLFLNGRQHMLEHFVDLSERKDAEELVQLYARQSATVNALRRIGLENLPLEEMLQKCLDEILFETWLDLVPRGAIFLVDDDPRVLVLQAQRDLTDRKEPFCARVEFGKGHCGEAAAGRRVVFTNQPDELRGGAPACAESYGSYCVPIQSASGVQGILVVCVEAGHRHSLLEEDFLSAVAGTIASIILRKQTEQQLRQTLKHQAAVNLLQQSLLAPGALAEKLTCITDATVRIFDADFCRVWVTKPGDLCERGCVHALVTEGSHVCRHRDRCLHLLASSGRYTHTDGQVHRRVPFGCYKIGRVASGEDTKFLTNEVTTDPRVHNHEWARQLGLVSFAGYQLRPPGRPTIGVLALFSKHAISPEIDAALESLANTAARVILSDFAEQERSDLQDQLSHAQRLESVGQLAAGIAHEINTPTQFVSDNTRFLQGVFAKLQDVLAQYRQAIDRCRNGPVPPDFLAELENLAGEPKLDRLLRQVPEAITDSLDGLDQITRIVRAISDFGRPGQESMSPADLNKAIESTVTVALNEWKYVADMKLDLDPALPPVPCVLADFNQVVLNIVVNAAQAIHDVVGDGGQGKGTITIATRRDGDRVEIRISDTGPGIPAEHRDKIFNQFFTTKGVGKGTGQGLALARRIIVEQHRGTLTFETDTGQGTTFIIRLPIQAEPASAGPTAGLEPELPSAPGEVTT